MESGSARQCACAWKTWRFPPDSGGSTHSLARSFFLGDDAATPRRSGARSAILFMILEEGVEEKEVVVEEEREGGGVHWSSAQTWELQRSRCEDRARVYDT
ncbi:unnamed protein product [Pleuronectes platessa]|uniref:Uncharacterized protein n=1 Tax=Pleuronectes platessa TaxID=8262 RepID=A0A9N7Z3T8_PLEPL|nr:unnamed protein product [Pleuronectes platessa]